MATKQLKDFKPQRQNINKGNPRGLTQLNKSIQRDGYSAPMVAAADGEIFAGSKRLESAADIFGTEVEPLVVHSDGTRPVIHVRDDIPDADDPKAIRLGAADNIIAHMDYNPDGELLSRLQLADDSLAEMVRQDDLSLEAVKAFSGDNFIRLDLGQEVDGFANLPQFNAAGFVALIALSNDQFGNTELKMKLKAMCDELGLVLRFKRV